MAVVLLAVGAQVRYMLKPEWIPTYYFLARDAVRERIRPAKLIELTGPSSLRIQRVDDNSTNIWGWVKSTNITGNVNTQWFRCVVVQPESGNHRVAAVELFNNDPGWTNPPPANPAATPSKSSPPPR